MELEFQLSSRAEEELAAKKTQESLQHQITTAQSEKSKVEEGLKMASEKIIELKKQMQDKETIHSLALAECKRSFHNLLEERDVELKNCRVQVDTVRSELEAAKKRSEELQGAIGNLKKENAALRESLESTEKRLDAEKLQLVQEVSKAKDAACEALQADFEKRSEELRKSWEKEVEPRVSFPTRRTLSYTL